jgi:hypothetical protein
MIRPRIPVNNCGFVQQQVLSAISKLPWQTVSVRLLSQLPDVNITGTAPGLPNPSGPVPGGTSGTMEGIPVSAANN